LQHQSLIRERRKRILGLQAKINQPESFATPQGNIPSNADESGATPEPGGEKRPRVDSSYIAKAPLKPPVEGYYSGKSIDEYHLYILRMEAYFGQYSQWFNEQGLDQQRILLTIGTLDDGLIKIVGSACHRYWRSKERHLEVRLRRGGLNV
jgi:hypothetical protein